MSEVHVAESRPARRDKSTSEWRRGGATVTCTAVGKSAGWKTKRRLRIRTAAYSLVLFVPTGVERGIPGTGRDIVTVGR
jgi:hypothetical protein